MFLLQNFTSAFAFRALTRAPRSTPGSWAQSPNRTDRFSTFVVPALHLNLVLPVNDSGEPLDTHSLHHIGFGVQDKAAVVERYFRAKALGVEIFKPPRTTWLGTPLHELWLRDPPGYGIEVYARLAPDELAAMPDHQEPTCLVAGTAS